MPVGSRRAEVPRTPASLSRWKEASAGSCLLPSQQRVFRKGIITSGCQDGARAHQLPRMWLMANLSSKEDCISRQLEAIQSKPSFTGRVSSCLLSSPLLPFLPGQPRACWDLKKELTVLDCFPNWEEERQKTRLWTHSQTQGGPKKLISLGALVRCYSMSTWWLVKAWAGPEHLCSALSILS